MPTILRFVLLFVFLVPSSWASQWYTLDTDKRVTLNVSLFLSSTCSHCAKENEFFHKIEGQNPWIKVQRYVINEDKNALITFNQFLSEQKMADFSVPSAFFCGSRWVGFSEGETTGKDILKALNYCKQQIEANQQLPQFALNALQSMANANRFDTSMVSTPSAAYYTVLMAFVDATTPCAYFCLFAFLALLFLQTTTKDRLIVGFLFIITLSFVHYFQQIYVSTSFALLDFLRWPAVLIGLMTCFYIGRMYRKQDTFYLSYPLAVLLPFIIQSYQQTCLMNFAILFQQWIHNQGLSSSDLTFYTIVYQFLYSSLLVFVLLVYCMLINKKTKAKLRERFTIIGQVLMLVIALLLIVYPWALSYLWLSLVLSVIAVIISSYLKRRASKPQLQE